MKKKSGIKGKCVGEYSDDEIRIELCCYLWLADGNDPDNKVLIIRNEWDMILTRGYVQM